MTTSVAYLLKGLPIAYFACIIRSHLGDRFEFVTLITVDAFMFVAAKFSSKLFISTALFVFINTTCLAGVVSDNTILMDSSQSIGLSGWESQKDFVEDFISTYITDDIRFSLIQFSSGAKTTHSLKDNQNFSDLQESLNAMRYKQKGKSNIDKGIKKAINEFDKFSSDTIAKQLFIITDGSLNDASGNPCKKASKLDRLDVQTFVISIGDHTLDGSYDCLLEDPNTDLFHIDDFSANSLRPIVNSLDSRGIFSVAVIEPSAFPLFLVGLLCLLISRYYASSHHSISENKK